MIKGYNISTANFIFNGEKQALPLRSITKTKNALLPIAFNIHWKSYSEQLSKEEQRHLNWRGTNKAVWR